MCAGGGAGGEVLVGRGVRSSGELGFSRFTIQAHLSCDAEICAWKIVSVSTYQQGKTQISPPDTSTNGERNDDLSTRVRLFRK